MNKKHLIFLTVMLAICLGLLKEIPVIAAQTRTITVKANATGEEIQSALNHNKDNSYKDGLVIRIPKGEYRINKTLKVYSNTFIIADEEARFIRVTSSPITLVTNYREPSGVSRYDGASNISIEGGVWDGNLTTYPLEGEQGNSIIVFVHCQNITVKNAVIKNSYNGHLIAIEAVKNALIENCKLSGYQYKEQDKAEEVNEAIQLDITHNEQNCGTGMLFDDTPCDTITIRNNTISNYARGVGSHLAVDQIYHKNIIITGNTFSNIDKEAVKAYLYYNVTISNNTITDCGEGIRVYTHRESYEKNNVLSRNSGVAAEKIVVNHDYKVIISNNNISKIKHKSTGSGIRVMGNASKPMHNVKITGNLVSDTYVDGISVRYTPYAIINSNKIVASEKNGIELVGTPNARITNNTINNTNDNKMHGKNGIVLYTNSDNTLLEKNTIKNIKGNGVAIYNSKKVVIRNSIISSVVSYGVFLEKSNNTKVMDNKIAEAKSNGIRISGSSKVEVTKNKINKGAIGISVSRGYGIKITTNTIKGTSRSGIGLYEGTDNANVLRNSIISVGENGITVSKISSIVLDSNTINTAKKNGMTISSSTRVKVNNNSLRSIKKHGISILKSPGSQITKNKINTVGGSGITLTADCKKSVIKSNILTGCPNNAISIPAGLKININKLKVATVSMVKAGTKKIVGKAELSKTLSVRVEYNKKVFKVKQGKRGEFALTKLPKLKKGTVVVITVADNANNLAKKEIKVK